MELEILRAGNVLANNGNGTDTLNGTDHRCDINYHYTSNGYQWWNVPIDPLQELWYSKYACRKLYIVPSAG
jgi:hypothetical protein